MSSNLPLLSLPFLTFALVATVVVASTRGGLRQAAFLAVNLFFLDVLLLGPVGTSSTLAFALTGWAIVRLARRSARWTLLLAFPVYTAAFVYMRDYGFVHWILPESILTDVLATVGLSFLFFKVLHVAIESESGTLGDVDFVTYLNYCLNFTTFMMGPIQRYQDHREQWLDASKAIPLTLEAHLGAVLRVLFGLFRAFVLGAWLDGYLMPAGTDVFSLSSSEIVVHVYAFYFFLYCNFGGYCDVAIGLGSLLGVRPPENFDHPYLSRNVSEFWQRQHRSLTLWLTDYIFTPSFKKALGVPWLRTRRTLAMSLALMLTMLVSGLWHGTTVGFLLFGLTHGVYLVVYHVWDAMLVKRLGRKRTREIRKHPLAIAFGIFLTFNATAFAFVFFQMGARQGLAVLERLVSP